VVEYQQNWPTSSSVEGFERQDFLAILSKLFPFLFGAGWLFGARLRGLNRIELVKNGVLVSGAVAQIVPAWSILNFNIYKVFVQAKTVEDVLVAATIHTHWIARLSDGAEVMLVYDSTNPQNAELLDMLGKSVKKLFGR
jgi:hypothetical protein